MRHIYRSLWLSDIHLGTRAARAVDLLAFLDEVSADVIYLAGDIVDLERLKTRPTFPALHREVIARFVALAKAGTRAVYIPGNHDVELRALAGERIRGIEVALEAEHMKPDGTKLLVTHGDCLDPRIRRGSYAEHVGSAAYQWLIDFDAVLNRLRRRAGSEYSSFSTRLKLRLSAAREYMHRFEEAAAEYALRRGFDGIVCGHIHRPCIRKIRGVCYVNDGDWIEHRSAVAETPGGQLTLLRCAGGSIVTEERPTFRPVAA
ncbi:MAG TPA: UDP-2,3-diacylglucosamine diphosphatase [Woeseiaceae bacterium]|jgi:UDP-2,3-diacylglucosamine pyrophosphatase LpxH|nr:UDP-2,3-diacylglucosamine diphosphatase [Woeseiaceae bacterium]